MKKNLIAALATKFEGVDAKILSRIADKIMSDKTIESEEDVNSAVEEVTFADILKHYGDSRATEATRKAVSNYEKKHGIKDGKPVVLKQDDDDGDDDDPDGTKKTSQQSNQDNELAKLIKQMSAKMDQQAEEIKQLKQGKVAESREKVLDSVIKDLKESQKKPYKRYTLDTMTDEEFDEFIEEVTGEVAEVVKENKAAEAAGFNPLLGGQRHGNEDANKPATDAEVDAIVGKLATNL